MPTPNESYQYDPLYRLKEVDGVTGALWQKYTYGKTDDRLSKNTAGITPVDVYHYTSGTHHLSSITGSDASTRAFDANGNTSALQANGWTYALGYNNTNRLSLVQQNGTTIMQYKLDGKGERVRKVPSSGTATEYAYDEAGKLLYEYVGPNTNRSYIWADDTLIATVEADSSLHYIYTDHLGTPRAVTNTTSGAPIWTWPWTQNPFGEKPASESGYALNVRYPGQYFDTETGLNYNYFRDYEAGTGRYIQSDLIGLYGGISTYAYVQGEPLGELDPLGLWDLPAIPDPVYNFLVGGADAASFGIGPLLRSEYDIDGPDVCSSAYQAGQFAAIIPGLIDGEGEGELAVVFGRNENQIAHAFRYTDELGLDRQAVKDAILKQLTELEDMNSRA